jgi:hypothetical protein
MPDDTLESNNSLVRPMLHAANTGDTAAVGELIDRNVLDHGRKLGLESTSESADPIRRVRPEILRQQEVFPDREFKEVMIVAEGDTVVLVRGAPSNSFNYHVNVSDRTLRRTA